MWCRPSGHLGRQNPTKDADNKLSILLSRQFGAFRDKDSTEKQQKDIAFSVFNKLGKCQVIETDKALTHLTIDAAFFACRSCQGGNRNAQHYCVLEAHALSKAGVSCLCNKTIFNQQIAWPLHSKSRKNEQKNDTGVRGRKK
jgi:hypothetical protein